MAKVLLLGLEGSLADDLNSVLRQLGQTVQTAALVGEVLDTTDASLIFAPAQNLDAVRRRRPDLPVVVTTRLPEVRDWLDALEAGASDYCGAPFEAAQVRWVLDTTLSLAHRAAA
jgi:DNA-binding NtrC family response regulator